MIDSNILEYKNLEPLNVSRETFPQFEAYCELLKNTIKDAEKLISKKETEIKKEDKKTEKKDTNKKKN